MIKISNSATIMLEPLLERVQPQKFGGWVQDAIGCALERIPEYQGCYSHRGAGQPDIQLKRQVGIEVKTTSRDTIELDENYLSIRKHFPNFKLVALRTDYKPFHLYVIDLPEDPPPRIQLKQLMDSRTPFDAALGPSLALGLSELVVAAGRAWTDSRDRESGYGVLAQVAAKM